MFSHSVEEHDALMGDDHDMQEARYKATEELENPSVVHDKSDEAEAEESLADDKKTEAVAVEDSNYVGIQSEDQDEKKMMVEDEAVEEKEETNMADKITRSTDSKKGLFDEPVLVEGKRRRHTVERLEVAESFSVKKTNVSAVGNGIALGDIEYVSASLKREFVANLAGLHRLCYGNLGAVTTRKRNLRKFNGFDFDAESAAAEKKKATAMKMTSAEINLIVKILGVEKGHTKEDAVKSVMKFLHKPFDMGKGITVVKKRKISSNSSKKAKKRKVVQKEETSKKTEKAMPVSSLNDMDANESENDESVQKDYQKPKKRNARSKKAKPSISEYSEKEAHDGDQNSKKKKSNVWGGGGPTDNEIDRAIDEIFKSVDLASCTMKEMCKKISEKFPNLDMSTYKSQLRERVKTALLKT